MPIEFFSKFHAPQQILELETKIFFFGENRVPIDFLSYLDALEAYLGIGAPK